MGKYMTAINHGENKIDLNHLGVSEEATPTELHLKTNGTKTGEPSFVMVMALQSGQDVYGQFSLETLNECLNELGYEVKKIDFQQQH